MQEIRVSKSTRLYKRRQFNQMNIVPAFKSVMDQRKDIPSLVQRLESCGNYIYKATCGNCGTHHFAGNHSACKSKFCAVCASARANAWRIKVVDFLKSWLAKGNKVTFLNLTVRDDPSLAHNIEVVQKAFRYMTHDNKSYAKIWKKYIQGSVRSIEIKLGANSGDWHTHIHALILHDQYYKLYDVLMPMWNESVKVVGGEPDPVTGKYGSVFLSGIRKNISLIKSMNEVLKYLTKFNWNELSNDKLLELYDCTHRLRFIQPTGNLFHLQRDVDKMVDDVPANELHNKACSVCGSLDLFTSITTNEMDMNDLVSNDYKAKNNRILNHCNEKYELYFDDPNFEKSIDEMTEQMSIFD